MNKTTPRAANPGQCVDAVPASTVAQHLGSSYDHRINRWRVTCPACGHKFEPQTTMSRYQELTCPKAKCRKEMIANYNAEPPTVTLVADASAGDKKGEGNA